LSDKCVTGGVVYAEGVEDFCKASWAVVFIDPTAPITWLCEGGYVIKSAVKALLLKGQA
jgi:hypothetical protein